MTVQVGKNAEHHVQLSQVKSVGIHAVAHQKAVKVIKLVLTTKEQIYANVVQRNTSRPAMVKQITKMKPAKNNTLKIRLALQVWLMSAQETATALVGKNAEHHAQHLKEKYVGTTVIVLVHLDHVKVILAVALPELLSAARLVLAALKHSVLSVYQNVTMKTHRQPAQPRE